MIGLSGLIAEPMALLQSLIFAQRLRRIQLPDDPIVNIVHWRSGTTFLHQLLACDLAVATARNTVMAAPQVALLLQHWIDPLMKALMTRVRPIDAVPWGQEEPLRDELGLARLNFDTNMGGMAFPRDYLANFRRHVQTSIAYERQWLKFCQLTWLHDGAGKSHWLIKNSVHNARVRLVLKHSPRARFVVLPMPVSGRLNPLVGANEATVGDVGGAAAAAGSPRTIRGDGGGPSGAAGSVLGLPSSDPSAKVVGAGL